jgi:vacuolar-type H+-ATPase subunit I/STV1
LESHTKILSTQAGNIILSPHKTADQTRQNFKDILKRVKGLEEIQAIETNEIRIFHSNIASLRDRTKNLETYIKQFSAEDLKRMQADEYVLDDLTNRVAILESTLRNITTI